MVWCSCGGRFLLSISRRLFMAASRPQSYWINTLSGLSQDRFYGVVADAEGNVVAVGAAQSSGAGGEDCLIAKYSRYGALLWSRTLGGGGTDSFRAVALDSSGDIIAVGQTNTSGIGGSTDALLARYSASGSLLYQSRIGGSQFDGARAVVLDSSDNITMAVISGSFGSGYNDFMLVNFNSGGVFQWARTLGGTGNDQIQGITALSSGALIASGLSNSTGSNDLLMCKYSSAGNFQWARTLDGTAGTFGGDVASDSDDNFYVYSENGTNAILAKYDEDGSIQWQRALSSLGTSGGRAAVSVDDLDNVLVSSAVEDGTTGLMVSKFTSDGSLLWSRNMTSAADDRTAGVASDIGRNIIVAGRTGSTGDCVVYKVPSNGARLGSHGSFDYSDAGLSSSVSTATDASASLTNAIPSVALTAATLTDAAATLTHSRTAIL